MVVSGSSPPTPDETSTGAVQSLSVVAVGGMRSRGRSGGQGVILAQSRSEVGPGGTISN